MATVQNVGWTNSPQIPPTILAAWESPIRPTATSSVSRLLGPAQQLKPEKNRKNKQKYGIQRQGSGEQVCWKHSSVSVEVRDSQNDRVSGYHQQFYFLSELRISADFYISPKDLKAIFKHAMQWFNSRHTTDLSEDLASGFIFSISSSKKVGGQSRFSVREKSQKFCIFSPSTGSQTSYVERRMQYAKIQQSLPSLG